MEKLSLLSLIEEASASDLPLGRYCLQSQATDLEIEETALLQRMQEILDVMRGAIDYGLTGIRSTGGLVGGDGLKLKNWQKRMQL